MQNEDILSDVMGRNILRPTGFPSYSNKPIINHGILFFRWNFSVGEHDVTFIKGQRQTLSTSMPEKDQETDGVTCTTEGKLDRCFN